MHHSEENETQMSKYTMSEAEVQQEIQDFNSKIRNSSQCRSRNRNGGNQYKEEESLGDRTHSRRESEENRPIQRESGDSTSKQSLGHHRESLDGWENQEYGQSDQH
jgi:hypothetical protein